MLLRVLLNTYNQHYTAESQTMGARMTGAFSGAMFFSYLKFEWGRVDKKSDKYNIRRKASSQKSDVPHTNSSMYFFL